MIIKEPLVSKKSANFFQTNIFIIPFSYKKMLPRWHIFLGAIFSILIWFFSPQISLFYIALVFFASFLIDFDHYLASVVSSKKILTLKESFQYHEKLLKQEEKDISKGIKRKSDFHVFHTLEFHALVGIVGIFLVPFLYIFIGMLFHSMLDFVWMLYKGRLHRREFFFFNWIRN